MNKVKVHLIVIAVFTLLTIITTYPQVRFMKQGIYSLSDQLFYGWVIERNIESFRNKPLSEFFNATIFYPYENTLAYGDHLLGETFFAAPFYLATGNPIFAQNVLILLSFILSGYGMFLYIKYLTGNNWAAFSGGVLFAFSHVRFNQYDHLNILSTQWLPFIFLYLHRFLTEHKSRFLVFFILFYIITSMFTVYYLLMVTLAAVVYAGVWWALSKTDLYKLRRPFVKLLIGSLIALLVMLPAFMPYFSFSKEFPDVKRVIQDNIFYSASLSSYFSTAPVTVSSRTAGLTQSESDGGLYLGFALIVIVLLTSLFVLRKYPNKVPLFFLFLSGIFFVLSLGPYLKFSPESQTSLPMPYYYLYYILPPLQIMRVPARFAIFMQLFLAVYAGIGLKMFFAIERGLIKKAFVAGGIVFIVVADTFSVRLPLTLVETKQDFPPVYHWLKDQPDSTAVLELPIPTRQARGGETKIVKRHAFMEDLSILDRDNVEAYRNYFSLLHGKRTVNGYSAFAPQIYNEIWHDTADFPDQKALERIKSSGIDIVIIHLKQFPNEVQDDLLLNILSHPEIRIVEKFGDDYAVRVL